MNRRRHTPEQIIAKLRQTEADLAGGLSVGQVCQKLGVSEQIYRRCKKEYGGMKRLRQLEYENARLKKAVADLTLGNHMLEGVRKWRVEIVSTTPPVLRIETEAYERPRGLLNSIGVHTPFVGRFAQEVVWTKYLNNIARHYSASYNGNAGDVVVTGSTTGSPDNPWRSTLPGYLR